MPFNLFITSVEGHTFLSSRSPYDERKDAQRTVAMCVASSNRTEDTEKQADFVCRVTTAPLGETVTHPATRISFRTEEVPS